MKPMLRFISISVIAYFSCSEVPNPNKVTPTSQATIEQKPVLQKFWKSNTSSQLIQSDGKTIEKRFTTPEGYERIEVAPNSFGYYLRNLPLKPEGSIVHNFDGSENRKSGVYAAVVDMDLDNRNLQQCADAVMRLRGEYLFKEKRYGEIHFNYLSDGKPRYFNEYANGDFSYSKFRKYLIQIFSYANTASLRDQLKRRPMDQMEIGDSFIQKGNPFGHAVIVVDMAIDKQTGKKVYLLAQSYMPAQDTQILNNKMDHHLSPWYPLDNKTIETPEWTFEPLDLRHF